MNTHECPSISLAEECRVEYQRERRGPSSGLISSDNFEGLKGEKVKLQLTGDKECGAFIRISTPSIRRSPKLNIVHKICSPFDGSFSNSQIPLLINSSTVYLDFKFAGKSRLDYFGALFDFHNVLTQGHPVPNSTCDTIYSSYGSPLSRGPMKVFGESELIRQLGGFVRCSTALIPQQGQTVTIKDLCIYSLDCLAPVPVTNPKNCVGTTLGDSGLPRIDQHYHPFESYGLLFLRRNGEGGFRTLFENIIDLQAYIVTLPLILLKLSEHAEASDLVLRASDGGQFKF
ncbi:unnamed protein product [Lepeophtheirus salmonis]|uniref:(salmon louse) hypothetical protein n=1 Tax=Lepeophtheirus salmonis TaxID=72036 RepID=A0A7R8CYL6_LEPSM|nr:unnamed protein product [Lepeophtheirus salmonis]CAF2970094.1 unnamed protein product [Lepeophtheirus salmonis]